MKDKFIKFVSKNALIILLAFLPPLILWFYFQRDSYGIAVRVKSNISVVTIQREIFSDIQVNYKGREIKSLNVIDIEIENVGNRPIQRNDFDTPIKLLFDGEIILLPKLIHLSPETLTPKFKILSPDTIEIEPLLLNNSDLFTFRIFILNSELDRNPKMILGRITNIKQLNLTYSSTEGIKQDNYLYRLLLAIVGIIASIISLFTLLRRAKKVIVSLPGFSLELSNKLEADEQVRKEISAVAKQLQISNYDYKSNLLLIRIKIETLLRIISTKLGYSDKEHHIGISGLTRGLIKQGLISDDFAQAIRELYGNASRELHDVESYLSETDYKNIQKIGLSIIAKLEIIYREIQ